MRLYDLTEAVVRKCSVKKDVLRNFAKFTGKHLYQSLLFNKVAGLIIHLLLFLDDNVDEEHE